MKKVLGFLKGIFDKVLSVFIWISFGITFLIIFTSLYVSSPFIKKKGFEFFGRLLSRGLCFMSGFWITKSGFENIDLNKQYIVMMNHVNLYDPFVFYGRFPTRSLAYQEEEHFKWPLYGWIMRTMGHIPITRSNPRKAMRDLKKGPQMMKEDPLLSLIIFPEGTRTVTGKLSDFKRGAFMLALEAGVEILPMIQVGAFERKKKQEWIVHPGHIKLIAEKPISTEGYDRRNVQELMDKTRAVFDKYLD